MLIKPKKKLWMPSIAPFYKAGSGGGSNNIVYNAASLVTSGTTTSSSCTITTTLANCIVVVLGESNGSPPSGISDDSGGTITWNVLAARTNRTEMYWALFPTAQTRTITLSYSSSGFNCIQAVAFSGVKTSSPADPNGALPCYTSTSTPLSFTTTNANDVLLAGYANSAGTGTAGTGGWQLVPGSGTGYLLFEYLIVSATQPATSAPIGTGTIASGIGHALVSS